MTPDMYAERAYDNLRDYGGTKPAADALHAQVNATLAVAAALDMLRFLLDDRLEELRRVLNP